ncbi:hypothetical protein AAC387_Pa10g0812 [Persea americana]
MVPELAALVLKEGARPAMVPRYGTLLVSGALPRNRPVPDLSLGMSNGPGQSNSARPDDPVKGSWLDKARSTTLAMLSRGSL